MPCRHRLATTAQLNCAAVASLAVCSIMLHHCNMTNISLYRLYLPLSLAPEGLDNKNHRKITVTLCLRYAARVNYQSRVCDKLDCCMCLTHAVYIVTPSTTLHASFAGDITCGSMCLSITRRMYITYYNWQSSILISSAFIIKFFIMIIMAS